MEKRDDRNRKNEKMEVTKIGRNKLKRKEKE